jgi:hypothetical protein
MSEYRDEHMRTVNALYAGGIGILYGACMLAEEENEETMELPTREVVALVLVFMAHMANVGKMTITKDEAVLN